MKVKKILLMSALLISLCSCDSCDDDTGLTVLPPETQTGANTFGCYVNGELFVSPKGAVYWQQRPVRAEYNKLIDLLIVGADARVGEGQAKSVGFSLKDPNKIGIRIPDEIEYIPVSSKDCFSFGGKDIGEVTITKFDTINKIVSGRFRFDGQCLDSYSRPAGDSIVKVTDGRFDIQLDITAY